ncbi:MAG: PAS domain S-box protein [Anaerolineae bacterium]
MSDTVIDNIPVGVYRTTPGPQGRILMANPAFLLMFGIPTVEDLERLCVSDLYQHPEERRDFSETVSSQGSVTGWELALARLDGTPIWGSVTAKAVRDPETGEIAFFDCTIEDITLRKRRAEIQALLYRIASAAQAEREEQALFRAIQQELGTVMDTTNFFVVLYDGQTDTLSMPYFVDERDHFATFPAGKTLTARVVHDNQPLLVTRGQIEAMNRAGDVDLVGTVCEVWLGVPLEAGGEVVGALVVQSYEDENAFGQEEQEILGFVSSQIGLAVERLRAEQELRRLKEFNEGLVQSMAEGIAVQDAEGYFTFLNPAAGALLGYQPQELVGKYWTDVVPPDQQHIVQAADARRLDGSADRYVVELLRRDGQRFPVLISGSPRLDPETGEFDGTIAVFTDIGEQVRAEAALAQRAREMSALYETTLEISAQRDLATLLKAIVERAAGLLDTPMGGLYLVPPGSEELVLVVGHNLPPQYIGTVLQPGEGLSGRIAQSGEPLIVSDYGHWEGRAGAYEREHFRRVLGLPLKIGERVIGVINITDDRHTDPFGPDEVRLASLFADQAVIAIENARLLQAEREQRELAEALRQATASVSSSLDLDQIMDQILEQVGRVIPCDAVDICLVDGDRARIERGRGHEAFGPPVEGLVLPLDQTRNLRHMLETGQPLVVPDTGAYPGWLSIPETSWVRSHASSPIRARDRIIGFLNVNSATPGFFSQAHGDRLSAFADQASLALSNAELFRIVEQGKRDWEATFDAMPDPVILVDGQHRIVRANRAFAELAERPLTEIIGTPYAMAIDRSDCPEGQCRLERVLVQGQAEVCLHRHGSRIFEVKATPVVGLGGGGSELAVRAVYAMRDVTERKRAEEETQRRNRELAFLNRIIAAAAARQPLEMILARICEETGLAFAAPRVAIILFDEQKKEGTIVAEYGAESTSSALGRVIELATNSAVAHLLEHRAALFVPNLEADGRLAARQCLVPASSPPSWLLLPLVVEEEVVGALEIHVGKADALLDDQVDLAQRVADQASSALGRARLEETQRRLGAAVEQAAEAVVITDTSSTVLYANPAFEQITGLSRTGVNGQSMRGFGRGEGADRPYAQIWDRLSYEQSWQGRVTSARPDGQTYVVDLNVSPVRSQSGETINYVCTMRDVTREVQLEEQFRQAQKMEALGRLAGGIAHDFNNLLTVIHLSTRLLERQLRSEDPLWEHVQHIRHAGEEAAKLTKQLLSFSRREVIDPQVLDIGHLVGDLSGMLQRIIGEDIDLVTCLADDLWPVKAGLAQMEQVIMNLVVNARDAMPAGGALRIVTSNVTLDRAYAALHVDANPGDYVLLTVTDTGEGMSDAVKAHLFEPFFTTKERGQGTGLGLSTVFGIVKQNEGHIEVESKLGRGTTFKIYVPRSKEETAALATRSVSGPATPPPAARTVLVVEDDASVRRLAVRVLQSHGYRVLEASSGAQALEISATEEGAIDLLLADVVMPLMKGPVLADRLRQERPDLAVLYISGYADDAIGADAAFLPKPFTVDGLIYKVRALLQSGDDGAGQTQG